MEELASSAMGKCMRRSCRNKEQRATAAVEAAAYLTLRSGRRVPAAARSRQCHRRGGDSWCDKGSVSSTRQRRHRTVLASEDREEDAELPPSEKTPVVSDECCGGAAARREATKRSPMNDAVAPPPPPEAEMEAFFAAAEHRERRRFAETYNYDVSLDRPLEGRFEWSPATSTYVKL